ncbi:hypothetical protein [Haloarcula quadrata]|uniref:hypothetical protein n=1 Tax=Haloarcula quadrata TaxID=182779 RepID=UPI0011E5BAC5|nr:hypothetical protein [Haloarcula quadrata]
MSSYSSAFEPNHSCGGDGNPVDHIFSVGICDSQISSTTYALARRVVRARMGADTVSIATCVLTTLSSAISSEAITASIATSDALTVSTMTWETSLFER